MARIVGISIPDEKKVYIGLQYIYGIGTYISNQICEKVNIDKHKKVKLLTDEEIANIRNYIDANLLVEGDLRKKVVRNIKNLIDIGCYRGVRHRLKLPVRGQRTHTNAKTVKKLAKAV